MFIVGSDEFAIYIRLNFMNYDYSVFTFGDMGILDTDYCNELYEYALGELVSNPTILSYISADNQAKALIEELYEYRVYENEEGEMLLGKLIPDSTGEGVLN